jgi:hypothetical protein
MELQAATGDGLSETGQDLGPGELLALHRELDGLPERDPVGQRGGRLVREHVLGTGEVDGDISNRPTGAQRRRGPLIVAEAVEQRVEGVEALLQG